MILGREIFLKERIGCKGYPRNDKIYLVTSDNNIKNLFKSFKEEALRIVEYYGVISSFSKYDSWYLEYYKTNELEEFRSNNGERIFEIYTDFKGNWIFKENNELKFTVSNIEELKKKWNNAG